MDVHGVEYVALPEQGRRFREEFVVRLGDANDEGLLRLDGVARLLQDVATDDWNDTGTTSSDVWVVRRTTIRRTRGTSWPRYLERVSLTTWCGGVGAAWAERRTNVDVGGRTAIEAVALWVPTDSSGHPVRVRDDFFRIYGEGVRRRKVPGRVGAPTSREGSTSQAWPLRRSDIDLVGHVNNAAVWQAVSEVVNVPVDAVSVTHHAAIERDDDVSLARAPGLAWLLVDDEVRVSIVFATIPGTTSEVAS